MQLRPKQQWASEVRSYQRPFSSARASILKLVSCAIAMAATKATIKAAEKCMAVVWIAVCVSDDFYVLEIVDVLAQQDPWLL